MDIYAGFLARNFIYIYAVCHLKIPNLKLPFKLIFSSFLWIDFALTKLILLHNISYLLLPN